MNRWGMNTAQRNKARSTYSQLKKRRAVPGTKEHQQAEAEAARLRAVARAKAKLVKPKTRRKWKAPKPPRMTELESKVGSISSKENPSYNEMKKYAERVLQWSALYTAKVPLFIVEPTDEEWARQLDKEEAALGAKPKAEGTATQTVAMKTATAPAAPSEAAAPRKQAASATAGTAKRKKSEKKAKKGSGKAAPKAAPNAASSGDDAAAARLLMQLDGGVPVN